MVINVTNKDSFNQKFIDIVHDKSLSVPSRLLELAKLDEDFFEELFDWTMKYYNGPLSPPNPWGLP